MLNYTIHGEPVGMYISQTHEYAHHYAAVMEILLLFHLFNYHNTAIGRCNYRALGLAFKTTDRTAEEIDEYAQQYYNDCCNCYKCGYTYRIKPDIARYQYRCSHDTCEDKRVGAFVVEANLLYFLYSTTHCSVVFS